MEGPAPPASADICHSIFLNRKNLPLASLFTVTRKDPLG